MLETGEMAQPIFQRHYRHHKLKALIIPHKSSNQWWCCKYRTELMAHFQYSRRDPVSFLDPPWMSIEGGSGVLSNSSCYMGLRHTLKNVILLNLKVEFLMPQCIWTTTHSHLQKLKMAAMSIVDESQTSLCHLIELRTLFDKRWQTPHTASMYVPGADN